MPLSSTQSRDLSGILSQHYYSLCLIDLRAVDGQSIAEYRRIQSPGIRVQSRLRLFRNAVVHRLANGFHIVFSSSFFFSTRNIWYVTTSRRVFICYINYKSHALKPITVCSVKTANITDARCITLRRCRRAASGVSKSSHVGEYI